MNHLHTGTEKAIGGTSKDFLITVITNEPGYTMTEWSALSSHSEEAPGFDFSLFEFYLCLLEYLGTRRSEICIFGPVGDSKLPLGVSVSQQYHIMLYFYMFNGYL